ncbi:ribose transport system permease protein [Conexibacter arvalis]|uniref:Ribose transport system permease protein n=2 Tax=Conexibacter arvalis TaxID=912552 RepID=A0A840IB84_9ACTN|nr:ribose transport system permease protein [Conexibacter arvalis]
MARRALQMLVTIGVLPILLVTMIVVFGLIEPRFLAQDNILNILRQSTFLGIVAIGQMLVLITAGFDLSIGAIVALTSVVAATVMSSVLGDDGSGSALTAIVLGVGAGLLAGIVAGAVNGFGVAVLGVSPFIVTLGTSSIITGAALLETGGAPITGLPTDFVKVLGTDKLLGVPVVVYITAVIVLVMYAVLNRSRFGRYLYAIGGNEIASRLSGIRVGRNLMVVYILSGTFAAIAGLLLTARVGAGEPNLGASFALQSITAAVLGGVSLRGGEGKLGGVVFGALFIAMLSNGMNLIRVSSYWQSIALGALLVLAVVVDRARQRVRHTV